MAHKPDVPKSDDSAGEILPQRAELLQVFIDAGVEMEPDLEALLARRSMQKVGSVR